VSLLASGATLLHVCSKRLLGLSAAALGCEGCAWIALDRVAAGSPYLTLTDSQPLALAALSESAAWQAQMRHDPFALRRMRAEHLV
jgi:hypothetical protein